MMGIILCRLEARNTLGVRSGGSRPESSFHELYAVDCPDAERREAIPQIWEHAWARAIVMRFLAQERPELGPTPEQAYLARVFSNVALPFLIKALSHPLLRRHAHGRQGGREFDPRGTPIPSRPPPN